MELMEATGMESWATIHPRHVTRRVGLGVCKPYLEIWDHLQVEKGELLQRQGPESLLQLWENPSDLQSSAAPTTQPVAQ